MVKNPRKRAPRKSLRTAKKEDKRGKNPNSLANLEEHKFPKGVSGNPGGRPKLLGESYREYLATVNPRTGRTRAEDIARAVGYAATAGDIAAAREIRAATEGDKLELKQPPADVIEIVVHDDTTA